LDSAQVDGNRQLFALNRGRRGTNKTPSPKNEPRSQKKKKKKKKRS
jgi:hypothetical protein